MAKQKEEEVRRREDEARRKEEEPRQREEEAREATKRKEDEAHAAMERNRREQQRLQQFQEDDFIASLDPKVFEEQVRLLQQAQFRKREEEIKRTRAEERKRQDSIGPDSAWTSSFVSASPTAASNANTYPSSSPNTYASASPGTSPGMSRPPPQYSGSFNSDRSGAPTWGTSNSGWSSATKPTTVPSSSNPRTSSSIPSSFGKPRTGSVSSGTNPPGASPLGSEEWARRQQEFINEQHEKFRREQEKIEAENLLRSAGKPLSRDEMVRMFENHEKMWNRIAVPGTEQFTWSDIPWPMAKMPKGPDDISQPLIGAYMQSPCWPEKDKAKSTKDRIKDSIKRWHPDRFDSWCLMRVVDSDQERVKEGSGNVVRYLSELLRKENEASITNAYPFSSANAYTSASPGTSSGMSRSRPQYSGSFNSDRSGAPTWGTSNSGWSSATKPTTVPSSSNPRTSSSIPPSFGKPRTGSVSSGTYPPGASPLGLEEWQRRRQEFVNDQHEKFRREQEKIEAESLLRSAGKPLSRDEMVRMFENHEKMWNRIAVPGTEQFTWSDIPWPMAKMPKGPDDISQPLIGAYMQSPWWPEKDKAKSTKDRIKDSFKRWHPDRFDNRCLMRVVDSDQDRVKEGSGNVVRYLNELLRKEIASANGIFLGSSPDAYTSASSGTSSNPQISSSMPSPSGKLYTGSVSSGTNLPVASEPSEEEARRQQEFDSDNSTRATESPTDEQGTNGSPPPSSVASAPRDGSKPQSSSKEEEAREAAKRKGEEARRGGEEARLREEEATKRREDEAREAAKRREDEFKRREDEVAKRREDEARETAKRKEDEACAARERNRREQQRQQQESERWSHEVAGLDPKVVKEQAQLFQQAQFRKRAEEIKRMRAEERKHQDHGPIISSEEWIHRQTEFIDDQREKYRLMKDEVDAEALKWRTGVRHRVLLNEDQDEEDFSADSERLNSTSEESELDRYNGNKEGDEEDDKEDEEEDDEVDIKARELEAESQRLEREREELDAKIRQQALELHRLLKDERRTEEEARKFDEEVRQKEEEAELVEARRVAERLADEARKKEEETKRKEKEVKEREEDARRKAEGARKLKLEATKKEEETKIREQALELQRLKDEGRRVEEEARKFDEEVRRKEAELRRKEEEAELIEARRAAERLADEAREEEMKKKEKELKKREEDARKKAEDARKLMLEAAKKAEETKRKEAEVKLKEAELKKREEQLKEDELRHQELKRQAEQIAHETRKAKETIKKLEEDSGTPHTFVRSGYSGFSESERMRPQVDFHDDQQGKVEAEIQLLKPPSREEVMPARQAWPVEVKHQRPPRSNNGDASQEKSRVGRRHPQVSPTNASYAPPAMLQISQVPIVPERPLFRCVFLKLWILLNV
jgi:hypothetical protein